jgi:hypothetical protein
MTIDQEAARFRRTRPERVQTLLDTLGPALTRCYQPSSPKA